MQPLQIMLQRNGDMEKCKDVTLSGKRDISRYVPNVLNLKKSDLKIIHKDKTCNVQHDDYS